MLHLSTPVTRAVDQFLKLPNDTIDRIYDAIRKLTEEMIMRSKKGLACKAEVLYHFTKSLRRPSPRIYAQWITKASYSRLRARFESNGSIEQLIQGILKI